MTVETYSPAETIILTPSALSRVQELGDFKNTSESKFRIYVAGGGCSGFSYGFELAKAAEQDDTCIHQGQVTILIDSMSLQYLTGAQVDYKEDLQGKRFYVNNPNATTTCGCGHSFSV